MPLAVAIATSCTAVAPASRMWYPQNSIGSQCGTIAAKCSTTSTASIRLACGGKMNVPRAVNSLSGSFWSMTRSESGATPSSSSATSAKAAKIGPIAFAVVRICRTSLERKTVEQRQQIVDGVERRSDLADLSRGERVVGVEPHLRRQVERDREAGLTRVE